MISFGGCSHACLKACLHAVNSIDMACIHLHGLYTAIGSTVLKTGEFILPAGKDTCLLHQPFSELQKEEYFRP